MIGTKNPLMKKKNNRIYQVPFAELVDKLTIDQIKSVLATKGKKSIQSEINILLHDIDIILKKRKINLNSKLIINLITLAQINLHIWELKDKMKFNKKDYNKYLKLAHQLNGIRNKIKNYLLILAKENKFSNKRSNDELDGLKGWDKNL